MIFKHPIYYLHEKFDTLVKLVKLATGLYEIISIPTSMYPVVIKSLTPNN